MKKNKPKKEIGHCYKLAWKYLKKHSDNKDMRLVHGKAYNSDGLCIDHAWIEEGEAVIDLVQDKMFLKNNYYQQFKIDKKKVRKYTWNEALIQSIKTNTYGGNWKLNKRSQEN